MACPCSISCMTIRYNVLRCVTDWSGVVRIDVVQCNVT